MRIKKTSNTRALAGKVVNVNSESTTDAYSCDYVNKLTKYSSTEKIIGHTDDDKPVYRKVFTGNWDGTGDKTISLGTNDILRNVYGFCYDGTYKRPLNSNWSQVQALSMIFTNNQILITQSGAVQPVTYVNYEIVAEYTKTTD